MLLLYYESRSTNDIIWKLDGFVCIFEVQAQPKKHWSDLSTWEMVMILCDIVISKMRKVLNAIKFISIFDDEVIAMDNNSWVGIHAYVLKR